MPWVPRHGRHDRAHWRSSRRHEAKRKIAEAWEAIGKTFVYVFAAGYLVSAFLLIASGVGYLKQSKFWGRMVGNVWTVFSIAFSLSFAFMASEKADGGFTLGTMVGLIYPVLTGILLNTTFKEDFVR